MAVFLSLFAGAGQQFFTNAGVPLAGGKIYTYGAGGSTPQATYTTSAGNIAHSNPIVLDAAGRVPGGGEIWLTNNLSYKFQIETSAGAIIQTLDNVGGGVDGATLAGSGGSALVGFIQAGSGAVLRTAQSKMRETFSVKDFGAVGDGVANDGAAIQATIDACFAKQKKGAVYIPTGIYKITTTINVPYGVSIYGDGATSSEIKCYDCDGLNFITYGYQAGSMFYEDFGLTAESGTNRAGIVTLENASTMNGIYISRMRFYGWNQCIIWRANWECSVENSVFYNVNQCVSLDGANGDDVFVRICNNRMTCVGGGLGPATRWAISALNTTKQRESLQISGNYIYGFVRAVFIQQGYVVNILNNDIGACSEYGIIYFAATGVYTVQGNIIGSLTGTGLYASALGAPDNTTRSLITGNNFVNQSTASTGIQINSPGQTNQFNLCIRDNWFGGYTANDILTYNPGQTIIDGNRLTSSAPTNSIVIGDVDGVSYPNRPPVVVTNNYFEKAASLVTADYTNGWLVYFNNIENGTFRSLKQAAAPVAGTWRVGDIVMNSAPSAGQPPGWVCTVAGTPGTWKAMANLV